MSDWTDERVGRCLKLWADGWSAAQIAKTLGGITRNGVLGKVHRMGKAERFTASKPVRAPLAPSRPTPSLAPSAPRALVPRLAGNGAVFCEPEAVRPPREAVDTRAEPAGQATIHTLAAYQCKWPIGDPQLDSFRYCGRRAPDGPYCEAHRKIAYQPLKAGRPGTGNELARSLRRYI